MYMFLKITLLRDVSDFLEYFQENFKEKNY